MKDKKDIRKEQANEIEAVLNAVKKDKEENGVIPADNKKIIIIDGQKDFSGKSLKIQKGLFKNGQNYSYAAGTKWEDIDIFGRKNIHFSESDFI
jgi:hypothetical protein